MQPLPVWSCPLVDCCSLVASLMLNIIKPHCFIENSSLNLKSSLHTPVNVLTKRLEKIFGRMSCVSGSQPMGHNPLRIAYQGILHIRFIMVVWRNHEITLWLRVTAAWGLIKVGSIRDVEHSSTWPAVWSAMQLCLLSPNISAEKVYLH